MEHYPPGLPGVPYPQEPWSAFSASAVMGNATRPLGRPARILFLHPSDELYGADLALLNMLRGLDRHQFQPYVVISNDLDFGGLFSRELDQNGIPHHSTALAVVRHKYLTPTGRLEFRRRRTDSTAEISQLVRDEGFDLVYTNTLSIVTGAYAARQTGRPHLWHVHEQFDRTGVLGEYSYMRRFVPRHADRVISASRAGLDYLLTPEEARRRGVVIYNGQDPQRWVSAPGREAIRAELGCGPRDVLFGMAARLAWGKAPDHFVEAAAHLVGRYPFVRFFLAGGAVPEQASMVAKVQRLIAESPAPERIHLLGYRRDTPALMAALDVLVQPSRQPEGASMSIVQAMFAGKPVIASNLGGTPELVAHDETGLLVPPDDLVALVGAMEALALQRAPRDLYGLAGQRRAMAYFTLDQQVAQTNELLYEEVLRLRDTAESAR